MIGWILNRGVKIECRKYQSAPIMKKINTLLLIVLAVLNAIVLIGQLWPAGAPPFARTVNIITLLLNLIFIGILLTGKTPKAD